MTSEVERVEQIVSAWAFAHSIDGAARNDLFARLRAALSPQEDALPKPTIQTDKVEFEGQKSTSEDALRSALEFYAEPSNWHGVYMVGKGPMSDDWSDDCADNLYPDGKPGKRARQALDSQTAPSNEDALREALEEAFDFLGGVDDASEIRDRIMKALDSKTAGEPTAPDSPQS